MSAWAYICDQCKHPASEHRLMEGGDVHDGPYICHCGHAMSQDTPMTGVTRQRFEQMFPDWESAW